MTPRALVTHDLRGALKRRVSRFSCNAMGRLLTGSGFGALLRFVAVRCWIADIFRKLPHTGRSSLLRACNFASEVLQYD
jgi:hypothetical protein